MKDKNSISRHALAWEEVRNVLDGAPRLDRERMLTDIYYSPAYKDDPELVAFFEDECKGSPKFVEDELMKLRVELLEVTLLGMVHGPNKKKATPVNVPEPQETKQPPESAVGPAPAAEPQGGPLFSKTGTTILDLYKLSQLPDYTNSPAIGFLVIHAMHMTGMLPHGIDNSMWNKDQRAVFGHAFINIYRFLLPLYMREEITDPNSLYAGAHYLTDKVMKVRREVQIHDIAEAMVVILRADMEDGLGDGPTDGYQPVPNT